MQTAKWWLGYAFISLVGLWLALVLTLRLATPSLAQEQDMAVPAELTSEGVSEVPSPPPEAFEDGGLSTVTSNSAPRANIYQFDPATVKRNPFRPYRIATEVGRDPVPVKTGQLEVTDPLLRFPVADFKVVGIIWDVAKPKAILQDPDGGLHTVLRATRIGLRNGMISRIHEGEVVISETVEEEGSVKELTSILELKR